MGATAEIPALCSPLLAAQFDARQGFGPKTFEMSKEYLKGIVV